MQKVTIRVRLITPNLIHHVGPLADRILLLGRLMMRNRQSLISRMDETAMTPVFDGVGVTIGVDPRSERLCAKGTAQPANREKCLLNSDVDRRKIFSRPFRSAIAANSPGK